MSNIDYLHEELENFEMVRYRIGAEGFHYCFKHYSSFKEINDEEFHKLREQYLNVSEKLERYIESKIIEIQDKIDETI
jgi:hypothetical protein